MSATARLGWPVHAVASAVSGQLVGDGEATVGSVATDSRSDVRDAVFVAIRGERFDGHEFVVDAIAQGAAVVIVDRAYRGSAEPRIVVDDTVSALLDLAVKRRGELTVPVIAITGSTGKTSTKDLVAAAIPGSWSSPRSFNNEIGLPLTVVNTPHDSTAVVLEVGSRGSGHISSLQAAIRPDVAVVTNLGVVHLETFGSEDGLADAKYELIEALGPSGVAIVPDDEPRLQRGTAPHQLTFGEGRGDVSFADLVVDALGHPTFTVSARATVQRVSLEVAGAHQAHNAAAAVCVAVALGYDIEEFVEGLSKASGSAWRMEVHEGRFTVVNDAYNANPQSVAAALETLAAMRAGRRYAVLGPMAELGPVCETAHRDMGELAVRLGIDGLIVVGVDHGYGIGAGSLVTNAMGIEDAADTLRAVVEPGDVVLVKASRSAGLERLAIALVEESRP
ncbi:MAG TPA: UDP-N-acetylmuramoyl-tripeptide--D-alanyl-D-alanine ligase [Acidimicrobiia bacterium]|nr:UDP-N-acetylmuramoyl-tripeptide--D-alanyl-D-alanine ligase [Acidimicrobiia bacterium]